MYMLWVNINILLASHSILQLVAEGEVIRSLYFILESVLFDVPRAVYRLLSLNIN